MAEIGQKIQEHRKENGWTQEELAKRMGISRATVAQYEADKRKPKYETIVRFADALGTSVDSLLGQEKNYPGIEDSVEKEAFELNRIIELLNYAVAGVRTEDGYKMWLAHAGAKFKHYELSYTDMRGILDDILSYALYLLEKFEKNHTEVDISTEPHFLDCEIAGEYRLYPELNKVRQPDPQDSPAGQGKEEPETKK